MARDAVRIRIAALAGIAGPPLFLGIVIGLSVAQYDFMRSLGWHPLRRPDLDWPSGLALGPYGWLQAANFAVSGSLLAVFATGLRYGISRGRRMGAGATLLTTAGVAMALLIFKTDPTLDGESRTLHGWVHDAAFVVFAVSLVAALFALGRQMSENPAWRVHGRRTRLAGVLAAVSLFLPGVRLYAFLVVTLVWIEATAIRLWSAGKTGER